LYAFGKSVNGNAAIVDDCAALVARPAPYLPLFSQRKSTGNFKLQAVFSASQTSPSLVASSPSET
jgi:hypothetical protein